MTMTVRKRLTAALTYLVLGILFVFVIFPIFYTFMGAGQLQAGLEPGEL